MSADSNNKRKRALRSKGQSHAKAPSENDHGKVKLADDEWSAMHTCRSLQLGADGRLMEGWRRLVRLPWTPMLHETPFPPTYWYLVP